MRSGKVLMLTALFAALTFAAQTVTVAVTIPSKYSAILNVSVAINWVAVDTDGNTVANLGTGVAFTNVTNVANTTITLNVPDGLRYVMQATIYYNGIVNKTAVNNILAGGYAVMAAGKGGMAVTVTPAEFLVVSMNASGPVVPAVALLAPLAIGLGRKFARRKN